MHEWSSNVVCGKCSNAMLTIYIRNRFRIIRNSVRILKEETLPNPMKIHSYYRMCMVILQIEVM